MIQCFDTIDVINSHLQFHLAVLSAVQEVATIHTITSILDQTHTVTHSTIVDLSNGSLIDSDNFINNILSVVS